MTAIGFIGLGRMGTPMAARLADAGHALTVLDISEAAVAHFCAAHPATAAARPRDLAQSSNVVITMLPTSAVVADVLYESAGVLAALKPGALVIEMSSGVPARTQRFGVDVARAGGALIDAPVSGGVARAKTGDLAIMVGGPDEAVARARPLLEAMGSSILPTGPVGTAHAMKALNNLVSAAGFMISVEALLIGKRFGLDPAVMVDVLNASTGVNNATQRKLIPFVLSRSFDSGFGLDLMVKDLSIALDVAHEGGVAAPLASQVRELWAAALAMGVGDDHTDAARFSERLAGLDL
ncbi:MAG TPA: NAD(P)-dependent oxidoreductase [Caulobacteraceae bacterium]|nr:NAD(P)-dependent oxidoreductase [Caulobacteraceae bacterium]